MKVALFGLPLLGPSLAYYTGAEIRSKNMYFEAGKCTTVEWKAKPAHGNCVISLFSLFNADLVFGSNPPVWSEITFEVFGGSVSNGARQFQTQYISQANTGSSQQQHLQYHKDSDSGIPDIFFGFQTFSIEFCPAKNGSGSKATWKINGSTIRTESGGDLDDLVPPLDIYAATWVADDGHNWACTSNDSRPDFAQIELTEVKVFESGKQTKYWPFDSTSELNSNWDKSSWSFGGFDGTFSPDNMEIYKGRLFMHAKNV